MKAFLLELPRTWFAPYRSDRLPGCRLSPMHICCGHGCRGWHDRGILGWWCVLIVLSLLPASFCHAEDVGDDVEMLAPIEVPGTVVSRKPRRLTFPEPTWDNLVEAHTIEQIVMEQFAIPDPITVDHPPAARRVILDPTGKIRGIRTPVTPVKMIRPLYPRSAREHGWEGTVVLRLTIGPDGRVVSAKTHTSSGYAILDRSALQAVQQWTFKPAKDGEFPISATVDLPIRFDLRAER